MTGNFRLAIWISSLACASSYKAAFAVHEAVSPCGAGSCGKLQKAASVKAYEAYAADAASRGAQIIVFPEYGITGESSYPKAAWVQGGYSEAIPDLIGEIPCNNASHFPKAPSIISLSCIAKQHKIALVANLIDFHADKIYNTDVAFDTDGTFLAKYHKQNLWGEGNIDVPDTCANSTFLTSFGITFGMFTCADLIFQHPAVDMAKNGVLNFVVPMAWTIEMADLQPMAYGQGWSAYYGVNLIVSNLRSKFGGGSGIWAAGRTLASQFMPRTPSQNVIVAEVPEHSQLLDTAKSTGVQFRFDLGRVGGNANWRFVDLSDGHVCSGSICCSAKVLAGSGNGYALGALDGLDSERGVDPFPAQACGVLPCPAPGNSCLQHQASYGHLHGVQIDMVGLDTSNVIPEVIATNNGGTEELLLAYENLADGFNFSQSGPKAALNVSSSLRLSSAILYGRQFTNDRLPYTCPGPDPTPSASSIRLI